MPAGNPTDSEVPMLLEAIESKGLAHLSYVIGDTDAGVCAVIDPRRDVSVYLDIARRNHCRITQILETHIHADFISGSRELQAETGAPIYVGAAEGYGFEHRPLKDGDTLKLGALCLKTLHTPGHTPEHVCFLVSGGKGSQEPWALFTGDTLFAGEVGRPDLIGGGTEEPLARQLFHSLHKLICAGDEVEIYPAHGEGSPCGGNIGDRKSTTVGYERLYNRKLRIQDEREFMEAVLSGLPEAPAYYPRMKEVNAAGARVLGCLPAVQSLDPGAFHDALGEPDAVVLDTREMEAFGGGHIEDALNIGLRAEFPIWAGWMLRPEERLLLVLADEADLDEVQRHLLRIGIENVAGFLRQGMRGWFEAGLPFRRTQQLSVRELHDRLAGEKDGMQLLDVRRPDEWRAGVIPTARCIFTPHLSEHLEGLDRERPAVTYCGSGYRASIAASVLERSGFREVLNVPGSMKAWKGAGFTTVVPDSAAERESARKR